MFQLSEYREKLLQPHYRDLMLAQHWQLMTPDAEPAQGLYYMVVGLCELTGEVLKGAGVYEPSGRWTYWDHDEQIPRSTSTTGWCFLDAQTGLLYQNKEIIYYKCFAPQHRREIRLPWVTVATQ